MSTVAVGSLWQTKIHPSTMVKVIHTFDHAEIDKDDKERYIIFEKFHRGPRDIGLGVFVQSKTVFLSMYERPPMEVPKDAP